MIGSDESRSDGKLAGLVERMDRELSAIRKALRRPLEAEIAKGKLTAPQTSVMQVVVQRPGIRLKDLSNDVHLAHSTVSGIVDRLEKRGMVERRVDASDGRVSCVFPTSAVTAWMRERMPVLTHGPLEAALERATEAERAEMERALRRLRELLEEGGKTGASF